MEREQKTITTPKEKHEVILKTYITGREQRMLRNALIKDVTFQGGKGIETSGIKSSAIEQAENIAIDVLVVSVDGKEGNEKLDAILDMHVEDYNFVISEIDKIRSGKDVEEKKMN